MPNAYLAFAEYIQKLLDDKVPAINAFRIYTNAGLSLINQEDYQLHEQACELIEAGLRLNPQYDFGLQMKKTIR